MTGSIEWMSAGLCRPEDIDLFFPEGSGHTGQAAVEKAVAICNTCPVIDECRRHALDNGEVYGVWGGLTEKEREAMRRGRMALATSASCGTRSGYVRHYRQGEPYCELCREANATWSRTRRATEKAS